MRILVDMDDTIENLGVAWVAWLNKEYNRNVDWFEIRSWDMLIPYKGLTEQELYGPLNIPEFWDTVTPKPDAQKYLKMLIDEGNEVIIVTSSYYKTIAAKVEKVLFKYFPYLTWSNVIIAEKKQLIPGDVLIDDGPHNLEGGSYRRFLFHCPHNTSYPDKEQGMLRVHDWEEVYRAIHCLASEQMYNNMLERMGKPMNVILYSLDCPKCKILEQRMKIQGIEYSVVKDADEMMAKGFKEAPKVEVDGNILNFQEAIQWLQQLKNKE